MLPLAVPSSASFSDDLSTKIPTGCRELVAGGCAGPFLGHDVVPALTLTQDAAADELLSRDPLALLLGMLFDLHVSRGTVRAC